MSRCELTKIRKFPPYVVSGARLTTEEDSALRQYMLTALPQLPVFCDGSQIDGFDSLVESHISWAKERLALSPQRRIPLKKKIKIYYQNEFIKLAEFFRKQEGFRKPEGWAGSHIAHSNEIILCDTYTINDLNHELVHSCAHKEIKITRKASRNYTVLIVDVPHYGFFHNDSFKGFNEAITEMINVEILGFHTGRTGQNYSDGKIAYHEAVLFFDILLKNAAQKLGKDISALLQQVYEGYYFGNEPNFIKHAFGEESYNVVARIKPLDSLPTSAVSLEKQLGINYDEYLQKLARYEAGDTVSVLDNCKIQIK
ncbi:MAG: hypothetical protein HY363_04805 [Candidatus Aenigmarchaeota archaeon]|nr:hypothetical protein [Candidatus Aenigmarchaeota archaeon]